MIKNYFLILFIYLSVNPVFAGFPEEIDSLEKRYSKAKSEEKIEIFENLFFKYSFISIDKAFECSRNAIKYGRENADPILEINGLLSLSEAYFSSGNIDSSYNLISSAIDYAIKINDKHLIAISNAALAKIQIETKQFTDAYINIQKAIKLCEEIKDKKSLLKLKLTFGYLFQTLFDFEYAIEQYSEVYNLSKDFQNIYYECVALNNLGFCYYRLKKYEISFDFYNRSFELSKSKNEYYSNPTSIEYKGIFYNDVEKDLNKALYYYKLAYDLTLSSGVKALNSTYATKISHIYLLQKQYDSAVKYANIALEERIKCGYRYLAGSSYTNLGSIYLVIGNLDKSEYYLLKSWDILNNSKRLQLIKHCASILYELYIENKKINNALFYYEIQSAVNDSINKAEQNYQTSELKLKYLFEKSEKEIELKILEEKKYNNIFYYVIISILILFGFIFYLILLRNKNLNFLLNKLNSNLEEKVKQRTTELEKEINLNKNFSGKLIESENKLRHFSENAQDLIFNINISPEFKITYLNSAIIDFTGYNANDFYDNPSLLIEIIYQDDKELISSLGFSKKQDAELIKFRFKHKNGDILWAEITITQFINESGNITELTGIARNISERMKAEEEMLKSFSQEKMFNELKNNFINSSSKELKEPLNNISIYADVLIKELNNLSQEIQLKIIKHTNQIKLDLDKIKNLYT